jgi:16S rRNA processing protein RimM
VAESDGNIGWVPIGRLKRSRGNRGEIFAEIYSSQPGRAERLNHVRLEKEGLNRTAQVERVWFHDGRPILKFVGVDSISDAEALQGWDILVEEAERALPAEGEFSHEELIGCVVWDADRKIGVVRGVEDYGSAPLLELETEDGREILIPFAREICREIDVAGKVIRAKLPEGLLDL